jgi:hypothetical protein
MTCGERCFPAAMRAFSAIDTCQWLRKLVKLNLGCGNRKYPDYVNVDCTSECAPDQVWDLENTPWPWESNSVESVLFSHSLEHVGSDPRVFKEIMRELYRVCRGGAELTVKVPHPRHDDFISDPTHVRVITPGTLNMLSKRLNHEWIKAGVANTPLAIYWGVDFEIKRVEYSLDEPYRSQMAKGELSSEEIAIISRERNNIVKEITILLVAIKG